MTTSADADAEIRTVLARIAQLADTGDLDEYLTLFTDDAVWAMPDNPAIGMPANEKRGHAEIRAGAEERRASGLQGPGTDSRHVLTTIAVNVESDDRATVRSYFLFFGSTSTHAHAAHDGSVRRRARARASAAGSSRTARSRSAEPSSPGGPMGIEDAYNFRRIDDRVTTSGLVSVDQPRRSRARGLRRRRQPPARLLRARRRRRGTHRGGAGPRLRVHPGRLRRARPATTSRRSSTRWTRDRNRGSTCTPRRTGG